MQQPPPATIGMPLADVDTPALLVELDAFEANLRLMQQATANLPVQVRSHAKTHKCPAIALAQIAHGAVGVCCQKVSEAEAMVDGGVEDVLISNEVVGAPKLQRVAALAHRAKLSICVDAAEQVTALAAAMRDEAAKHTASAALDVLVEIDVGAKRCGVPPGDAAVQLARLINDSPHLRFAGLQAYHGSAQHIRGLDERRAAIVAAANLADLTRNQLADAGIPCHKITGGGTGTFLFEAASDVYSELQPGSYIFMDGDYAANQWAKKGEEGPPRFQHSLFVWTTVMSRTAGVRAVVDAGLKALSIDSGMPIVVAETDETNGKTATHPQALYTRVSDEHGVIELRGAPDYPLGHKLKLIPGHCDPTVNMHDHYIGVRNGRVEAIWPITARGCIR
jgi:D-serine deaminase-like pyridoxal phosphate-dependent protein